MTAWSMIMAHLDAGQIQIASWYFVDGFDQRVIASWLGISRQAVSQRLANVLAMLDDLGIPRPVRAVHPSTTRSVRSIGTRLSGFA